MHHLAGRAPLWSNKSIAACTEPRIIVGCPITLTCTTSPNHEQHVLDVTVTGFRGKRTVFFDPLVEFEPLPVRGYLVRVPHEW